MCSIRQIFRRGRWRSGWRRTWSGTTTRLRTRRFPWTEPGRPPIVSWSSWVNARMPPLRPEPGPPMGSVVSDPGIPTLEQALDPNVLRECLPEPLPPEWGAIRDIQLQVLRHQPGKGRCTFEITLGTTSGSHSLIGKVYAEDRSDVYRAMEEIVRAGFGPEEEFAIPRPVAFLAPLRLLLYEKAPGTRSTVAILNTTGSDRALAAERCARWLARFHARGPRSGRVVHLNHQLRFLEECWRSLADL